jgi:hypothetical protein
MNIDSINENWPNSLRWFLVLKLGNFTPWHFLNTADEFSFAKDAFEEEDINQRKVFVFASKQDNDDFAGLEIINGKITDKVLYFHPVFGESTSKWDIVCGEFTDVFEFVKAQVLEDMKDWALTEDAFSLV